MSDGSRVAQAATSLIQGATAGQSDLTVATLAFEPTLTTPLIKQTTPTSDVATTPLTIRSQNAYSGAATNINGANLVLVSGQATPASGGTNGSISLEPGGVLILQVQPTQVLMEVNNFAWQSGITAPEILQNPNSTNSATGSTLTIQAQNCSGTTSIGGALALSSGSGTSTDGALNLQIGGTTQLGIGASGAITLNNLAGSGAGYVGVSNAGLLSWVAGAPPTGTAGGDLTGSYPNPTIQNITGSSNICTMTSGTSLRFGTNPSTTGLLNFPNNTGIYTRNAANSADIKTILVSSSNTIGIGDGTNNSSINLNVSSGSGINFEGSGTTYLEVLPSTAASMQFSANATASATITYNAPSSDTATKTLNISGQSAFASAVTNITGGALKLASGAGVVFGSESASENAGQLLFQPGGTSQRGMDGYGQFMASTTGIALTNANITLTAAEMFTPYLAFTGTLTGSVVVTLVASTLSGFVRFWDVDLSGITFSAHTITFSIGTGAISVVVSSLTTNANVLRLYMTGTNSLVSSI